MKLLDRVLWWWGFWRWRPRAYAHRTALRKLHGLTVNLLRTRAWLEKRRPRRVGEGHADLLTGYVASLLTGRVWRKDEPRPGPHLARRPRGTPGTLVGRPVVYTHKVSRKARDIIIHVGETEWLI